MRREIEEIWNRSRAELAREAESIDTWVEKTQNEKWQEFMDFAFRKKYEEVIHYVYAFFEETATIKWEHCSPQDLFLFIFLKFYVGNLAYRYAPKTESEVLRDLLNITGNSHESCLRSFITRENLYRTRTYVFYQMAREKGPLSHPLPDLKAKTEELLPALFNFAPVEDVDKMCSLIAELPELDKLNALIFFEKFYTPREFEKILQAYISKNGFDSLVQRLLEYGLRNLLEDRVLFLCECIREKSRFGGWLYTETFEGFPITRAQLKKWTRVSDLFANEIRQEFCLERKPALSHSVSLRLFSAMGDVEWLQKFLSEPYPGPQLFPSLGPLGKSDYLLSASSDEIRPLLLCILNGDDKTILTFFELYLQHFYAHQKAEFFLEYHLWVINRNYCYGSFFHFLARYKPNLVLPIYERLEKELECDLSPTLSRLDYLGLKVTDLLGLNEYQKALQAKISQKSSIRKVLALDLDQTLLLDNALTCEGLTEDKHYVVNDSSRCVYFRKTALKALILWVMHHPEMELFIITTSFRHLLDIRQILMDITGESERFLLAHLDGYFSGMNAVSEEYAAFLEKEGLDIRDPKSVVPRKWLQIKYLLKQRGHDLKNIKACLYDDRDDIVAQANAHSSYDLTAVLANLYIGKIDSLLKIAKFCEITEPLGQELPLSLQEFQVLFQKALKEDFVEEDSSVEWSAEEEDYSEDSNAENRVNAEEVEIEDEILPINFGAP